MDHEWLGLGGGLRFGDLVRNTPSGVSHRWAVTDEDIRQTIRRE